MKTSDYFSQHGIKLTKNLQLALENVDLDNILLIARGGKQRLENALLDIYINQAAKIVKPDQFKSLPGKGYSFDLTSDRSILANQYIALWKKEAKKEIYGAQVHNNIGCAYVWRTDNPSTFDYHDAYHQFLDAKDKAKQDSNVVKRTVQHNLKLAKKALGIGFNPINIRVNTLRTFMKQKMVMVLSQENLLTIKELGLKDLNIKILKEIDFNNF